MVKNGVGANQQAKTKCQEEQFLNYMENHRYCFSSEGYLHSLYYIFFLIEDRERQIAFIAVGRVNTFYRRMYGKNEQFRIVVPYTITLNDISSTHSRFPSDL